MRYELVPAELDDERNVFAVRKADRSVLGWIQQVPGGWRRFGYEDHAPVLATSDECVDDLIAFYAWEEDMSPGPPVLG